MDQAFTAILRKLIAEQGKEALLNPAKCKSLLADYTRNEHKKESCLLLQALEANTVKTIDSAPDLRLCKQQQVKILREEYFLAEEIARDLVDTLALVLRGDASTTEPPDKVEENPANDDLSSQTRMIKKRGLIKLILLSIITVGIYGLYWIHNLAKDVNAMCEGDGKKTGGLLKCLLLGLITVGIYNLMWIYKLGDRLQDNAQKYGLTIKESGGTILLWLTLGYFIIVGPFIAVHILIKNTNALADGYNKQFVQAS